MSKSFLVVVGHDLDVNSSANLCHLAYIRGLLENGCTVDVVSAGNQSKTASPSSIPEGVRLNKKYNESFYDRLSNSLKKKKTKTDTPCEVPTRASAKNSKLKAAVKSVLSTLKRALREGFSVYGKTYAWGKRAVHFRSDVIYDCVVSLAYPPVSHMVVQKLLKKKHIRAKRWVQIWEDPWSCDVTETGDVFRIRNEEHRLLKGADEIVYVSPLTLQVQKKTFPEFSGKMTWFPLPSYYTRQLNTVFPDSGKDLQFGYFGDYPPQYRNLIPFYEAAKLEKVHAIICGTSSVILPSSECVEVYPRVPLQELNAFEEKTHILVCLLNKKGGQIPGKIYQCAATDKIVLVILDGTEMEKNTLYEFFNKYGRFVFCENNTDSIRQILRTIREMGARGFCTRSLNDFCSKNIVRDIFRLE